MFTIIINIIIIDGWFNLFVCPLNGNEYRSSGGMILKMTFPFSIVNGRMNTLINGVFFQFRAFSLFLPMTSFHMFDLMTYILSEHELNNLNISIYKLPSHIHIDDDDDGDGDGRYHLSIKIDVVNQFPFYNVSYYHLFSWFMLTLC